MSGITEIGHKTVGLPVQRPTPVGLLFANRAALAAFVLEHGETIRRVARRKLSNATAGVYDSQDVLSTVLRRVDMLADRGAIRATTEREMLSLIITIAEHAAIDKTRLMELARSRLHTDGAFARLFLQRLNSCRDDDDTQVLVFQMFQSLRTSIERRLFLLRLRGIEHQVIAEMIGISPAACRKRWSTIMENLARGFQEERFR